MKFRNKILAIFLSLIISLSVSGLNFHFHFCGHENKLYTAIHLPDGKQHAIDCACTGEMKSCCQEKPSSEKHSGTCIDLQKSIETDEDYQLSQNWVSFHPAEHQLFISKELPNTSKILSSARKIEITHFYSPPDPVFTSTFLL